MPTYLPTAPGVYRVPGLGLCTKRANSVNGAEYWHLFDQAKALTGRNGMQWVYPVTGSGRAHLVKFAGSQWSNECHHTQRRFFRAMAQLDAAKYSNWNPAHVRP